MKIDYADINEFLNDVHEELSVKELIIDMGIIEKKKFKVNFTNCIFHDGDNTPSLQITDNFFKCYACGKKGDIFTFLQEYYNIDFIESVKKLAEFLNVNIQNIKLRFNNKINNLKLEWEQYLDNIQKAPDKIKELQRDYFPQEIGYDDKINYIVLPITSKTGTILGFTKRRIDFMHEQDSNGKYKAPKWKHSTLRDSLIGQCHNIFNLYKASPEIKKTQEVIVVEGPKDVVGYQRINKNNTICSCGTQNINNIWDIILPVEKITLSMDGDKAGIKSTIECILYLSKIHDIQNINVVELPDGEDPYSVKDLEFYYNNKVPCIKFFIKYADKNQILELYNNVAEYNKNYIIKEICLFKEYSLIEAQSWLFTKQKQTIEKSINEIEKESLLALVKGESENAKYVDIDRAKKILYMKYGIKIDD